MQASPEMRSSEGCGRDTFVTMHSVAIIGGGPAGMMAAYLLAGDHEVHLYERGKTLGRKFLVAGEGGLNITNSASGIGLLAHYHPRERMGEALNAFGPEALRAWLVELGIPTYTGTSGRIFPERGIKPAEVLKAIVGQLKEKKVHFHPGHTFVGFDAFGRPVLEHAGSESPIVADRYLFALGGASWPKTGSMGDHLPHFARLGLRITPFEASNCGIEVTLPPPLLLHAGKPLKNIAVSVGPTALRGEATITEHGLEGNAIYPVVPWIRSALGQNGSAVLTIDLKPDLTMAQLEQRLQGAAWKERMAALRLDRPAVALLKAFTPVERFVDGRTLAHDVKHVHVPVKGLRPLEEAISTVGGIPFDEVADDLSLKRFPNLFVAGEMLDWDAPTGGFLLQGAFSTGYWAAVGIRQSLRSTEELP